MSNFTIRFTYIEAVQNQSQKLVDSFEIPLCDISHLHFEHVSEITIQN